MKRSNILFLMTLFTSLITNLAIAKNISLYDQPKVDAKIVGTINSDNGIIPIFTPKDNVWIKVGDPNNGNVGWVKSSDLKNITGGYTFSQHIISTGTGPHNYNIVQFGGPEQLTPAQSQAMLKKMEQRQQTLQKDMQLMMQDVFKNNQTVFPMMVPVIIVPEKPATPIKAVVPAKSSAVVNTPK